MAVINFPANPDVDDIHVVGDVTWRWDGVSWRSNSIFNGRMPAGTTGQRPEDPKIGQIRYNTDLGTFEGYDGNQWNPLGSAGATPRLDSLGVGTDASTTTGEIRATNNITAFFSDDRLKTKLGNIENALEKLCSLSGFYYEPNQTAQDLGYEVVKEVGVSAQQVQNVLPEVVVPAPIDDRYLTVRYEKMIPLLIEAVKELRDQVQAMEDSKHD